jgi:oxygen-independent coproporphyrinogen-3 oxidase
VEFYYQLWEEIGPYLSPSSEKTIEANPTASRDWLLQMGQIFNRISFGVQSFNWEKLQFLGRTHTPQMAMEKVELAFKAGFRDINIDLIYGVRGDNRSLLEKDLQIVENLPVTHISGYSLTIEEGTPFARLGEKVRSSDEELELWFIERIANSFPQYEISNFGNICHHNLGYWEGREYRGIGAGAVGFEKIPQRGGGYFRYYYHRQIEAFIENPTPQKWEEITDEMRREERIFLGLRSIVGVPKSILTSPQLDRARQLVSAQFLRENSTHFYPTTFALADHLALEIISAG